MGFLDQGTIGLPLPVETDTPAVQMEAVGDSARFANLHQDSISKNRQTEEAWRVVDEVRFPDGCR